MNIKNTHTEYIDACNQFQSAIYQFCHAYQLLLTAYQQKEFSHSAPFIKKAILTFNKIFYLYTVKMSIWSACKSTLNPKSFQENSFDYSESLKTKQNRNNQSKKMIRGYTLFQFQVHKGRRKMNDR